MKVKQVLSTASFIFSGLNLPPVCDIYLFPGITPFSYKKYFIFKSVKQLLIEFLIKWHFDKRNLIKDECERHRNLILAAN